MVKRKPSGLVNTNRPKNNPGFKTWLVSSLSLSMKEKDGGEVCYAFEANARIVELEAEVERLKKEKLTKAREEYDKTKILVDIATEEHRKDLAESNRRLAAVREALDDFTGNRSLEGPLVAVMRFISKLDAILSAGSELDHSLKEKP